MTVELFKNQKNLKRSLVAGLMTMGCLSSLLSYAKETVYQVGPAEADNNVSFTSDAPVELIHGKTHKAAGTISYDDSLKFDAKHPFNIQFDVDLASIDTGIELRNEHMRDNFLETAKYPKAVYKVTSILTKAKTPVTPGQKVVLDTVGTLTLHGKSVMKRIPVTVTKRDNNTVRIQATFPVALKDHEIKRPEIVLQKLADNIFVSVDFLGKAKP
ncbi:MAG: YceI family protein [Cyanobacteria bacterium]|nr:YceI family protein [Cyanobacteriota bacterium]